jgi:HAD superfamily phosphatase (TIGR01668 family)
MYDKGAAHMRKPVIVTEDICQLTPEWLYSKNLTTVLSDLDNTLAGYGANVPDEAAAAWIGSLKSAGIRLMIISNARRERVAAFCGPLGLPFLARAGKPRARGLLEALETLGASAAEAVMVGDQYFTDIKAGYNAGMRAVLVEPRTQGFFFTVRRWLEIPFIGRKAERL